MHLRHLLLATSLALILNHSGVAFAATLTPRTCGAVPIPTFESNSATLISFLKA